MEKILRALFSSLFCWPTEALICMWGLRLLHDRGFDVPAPGYWSSFLVSLGLGLVVKSATLARRVMEDSER